MNSPEPVIRIRNLKRHFQLRGERVRALDGIDLDIYRGEYFGISGVSGSGKSTLLYLIGGMDQPTSGEILVNGQNINLLDDNQLAAYRRTSIGFIYQNFFLLSTQSALENVELPMLINRQPIRTRRAQARQLLETLGLADRLKHKPAELSGGQQQRIAIARALTNHPHILLADEPTGNLDSRNAQEITRLLRTLAHEKNITVIIVSHDPLVIAACDRFINLKDGRIVGLTENPIPVFEKGNQHVPA